LRNLGMIDQLSKEIRSLEDEQLSLEQVAPELR
jgi:exonuclease VII small subunit